MVKVIYNDKLVYKVAIWAFFGISLWKEKVALNEYALLQLVIQISKCTDQLLMKYFVCTLLVSLHFNNYMATFLAANVKFKLYLTDKL